ncbi:MAG: hypothetical protein M3P43_18455, partial [Actinomycetota bacterium]|nr:hypothetical protein [Actinomycetota bacterium]
MSFRQKSPLTITISPFATGARAGVSSAGTGADRNWDTAAKKPAAAITATSTNTPIRWFRRLRSRRRTRRSNDPSGARNSSAARSTLAWSITIAPP